MFEILVIFICSKICIIEFEDIVYQRDKYTKYSKRKYIKLRNFLIKLKRHYRDFWNILDLIVFGSTFVFLILDFKSN